FEQMAANAGTRTAFVNTVVNFVNAAGLDGVDIDWEYPDPGTSGNNYAALMRELGTAMHSRGKLLTAAVVANGYTGGGTGAYRLVNKASGRCVDINGPSTADGATIHQWACHTGTSQQWSMEATDSGYYRFVSRYSGKALDVREVSTADGAGLQQWSYGGGSNQQFKPVDLGNGYVRLEARHSGKVLDVTGCQQGSGDGTLLQQWTWSNNDCQQFNLEAL
ncbi:RICIN domain-containing protein, partial [Corallococcus sp. AB038B]|uniref:RICIN domain-containing protein n=1 Tax=Corallococcus sp. AB038B TaxID=2316718 RepID=UPI000ED162E4